MHENKCPHVGCVALPYPEAKLVARVCDVVSELPKRCLVGTYYSCEGSTRGSVVKVVPVGAGEGEGGREVEGGREGGREGVKPNYQWAVLTSCTYAYIINAYQKP